MRIKLTDEILEKIDKAKSAALKTYHRHGMGINFRNVDGAKVFINDHYVCDFEDFFRVAVEFQIMADIVKDATGIYIDE